MHLLLQRPVKRTRVDWCNHYARKQALRLALKSLFSDIDQIEYWIRPVLQFYQVLFFIPLVDNIPPAPNVCIRQILQMMAAVFHAQTRLW